MIQWFNSIILLRIVLSPCHYWVRNSGLFMGGTEEMSRIIAMRGRRAWATAAVATAGLIALAAPAASAATAAPTAAHWHIVKSVATGTGAFTAVAATGKTTGWAFGGQFVPVAAPTAWQLANGKWTQDKAFPGESAETVLAAGASSPSDVWAFTQAATGSRVLHYNGKAWSVAKTFDAQIGGASVAGKNDIWVFGVDLFGMKSLGAWYFNGHTWRLTGTDLQGGSALSPTNVWAFSGTKVYHFNGSRWANTQLSALLPPRMLLNGPAITGIIALSASNVYAIGNGNAEDEGGPTVVLHYNGSKWAKVATGNFGYGTTGSGGSQQVSPDGAGGLWLPMPAAGSQKSYLVHYAAGKLTPATLPGSPRGIAVSSISRVPGTAEQLAGGDTHAATLPGVDQVARVLMYS